MRNKEHILVIGGTGKTGRKVVEKLIKKDYNVRIGSRNLNPSFDWEKPENWAKSVAGMDMIYITFQPDLAVPGALEAIEKLVKVAIKENVKKLVLLSGKGEREAELCEQVVIHSGIDHTIIRASWFSQNFSESFFLEPILNGFVALPHAEAKVPYVDTGDIADVAVEVLLNKKHNNKIYELTGPELYSFNEVIAYISNATNREINFTSISLSSYVKAMKQQGVPGDFIWLIEYLFSEVLNNPNNSLITNDIEKILGRPAKDFKTYVNETALTGVWNN